MAKNRADIGDPLLLDFATAGRLLGISRTQIYREVAKGRLRAVSIATKARRIPATEIPRYVAERLREVVA